VVVVEAVDTPEEAVAAANRTMYGLSSSILSGDTYRAFELAPKIQFRTVFSPDTQAPVLSHSGARPGGLTIRLPAIANACMAAMSALSNSKSNTAMFSASRSIRVVLESATMPRC